METITTRSLWCGVYTMTRGWPLLGVELRDGIVEFRFDRGAQRDMRDYYLGRAHGELKAINQAHTALTVAMKEAKGLPTW
jgi:hypothetical protein